MSNDETQSALSRAYQLVEAGRYEEARAILDPILAANRNHADAWWIYAHAVTDAETGRNALENVLRIDPNYPGAAELLAQARVMSSPTPKIMPIAPVTIPEAPRAVPETDYDEFDAEEPALSTRERAAAQPPRRRSGIALIGIVAVIVVALVLAVLLLQPGSTPGATSTPTQVAALLETPTEAAAVAVTDAATETILPAEATPEALPTEAPTRPPTITPTLNGAQSPPEVTEIDYEAIGAALAEFPIAESGIGVVETSLGDTLLVSACTTHGRAMRTLLPQVMNAFARQTASAGSSVQAIGARMVNCEENTTLVTVAVELAAAQSYADGSLSDSEFAAMWKPQ